jgi:hypothetical protein
MVFDPAKYGPEVASILALDGNGERLMPLAKGCCASEKARRRLQAATSRQLFPNSKAPEAALSGLYLYFSCAAEAHEISQRIKTVEGSYWHGIVHRQEPDPDNAAYWFRQVGSHPIFSKLAKSASKIAGRIPDVDVPVPHPWDPIRFVELCDRARLQPGSSLETLALEIQRAEWQLLFDYCAREESGSL